MIPKLSNGISFCFMKKLRDIASRRITGDEWIFPKQVNPVKRKVSPSVLNIQLGIDTPVLSAFFADYKRPQYSKKWNGG